MKLDPSAGTPANPKQHPIAHMRLLCLPAALAVLAAGSAQATVHVYEGFDYPAQSDSAALEGGAFNGGSGLSGNWSGTGTYIYRSAGLSFSDLAVSAGSGCAQVVGMSHAFRKPAVNLTGTLWGSFLFTPVAAASMSDSHVADFYVTKSSAFSDNDSNTDFGVGLKRYGGPEGDVRLGGNTNPPSIASNSGGTALAVGSTYLVLYKVDNLIAWGGAATSQSITAWLLSAAQFDNFKSEGLTEAELNAATQGSASDNIMQRTSITATQKASFSTNDYLHFLAFYDAQGNYMYDEIRVSATSLADVVPVAGAPTDVALSTASVSENAPAGTTVGTLSTTDTTPGDTFTYSLVGGDTAAFAISGDTLQTAAVFDYSTQNSYSVRVRATDATNLFYDKDFTITVLPVVPIAPTGLALSASTVLENEPLATTVGSLSTTDPTPGDTFTYSLVGGDTTAFSISGNTLQTAAVFDYAIQNSYSVRIRTTDADALFFEEDFTITVGSIAPTGLALSASIVLENEPIATAVGTLSTTDPTPGDTFTYTLVGGDTAAFSISGDTLQTAAVFACATQNSYGLRIRTTDTTGRSFEQDFTIMVNPAGLTVYEGFNYPTQSDNATLDGANFNGGSGLGGNWSATGTGALKYRALGLTFSDLAVGGGSGCAQVTAATGVTAASRPINVNQVGTLWGSFLFQSISPLEGAAKVADLYVRKNATASDYDANVNFGVAPKAADVITSDVRLGGRTTLPTITPNTGGTALSQNTTYLVVFKVANLILPAGAAASQTISSWILSAAQYDHFKSDGLTEAELDAASQGSASDNIMQRTTLTASQKASFASSDYLQFLAHEFGDYCYDEIRVSATSLALVVPAGAMPDYTTWNATDFGAPFTDTLPGSDPDNDGLTNQQEYAFGLNPTSGSSLNPISMQLDASGMFQYTRRIRALTGLAYTVWTSTDLVNWTEDVPAGAGQSVAATHGEVETMAVTLSAAALNGRLFVRVQAQ
jgi:hypothetical protein